MPNPLDKVDMNILLSDVESLENIGIDVSFVSDVRKLYNLQTVADTHQVIFVSFKRFCCELTVILNFFE